MQIDILLGLPTIEASSYSIIQPSIYHAVMSIILQQGATRETTPEAGVKKRCTVL